MPAKAKLTTRERTTSNVSSDNLNKGSELSHAEADSNFINLRDQTIAISDGSTSTDIEAGETITFSGASVSGNTVTVPTGAGMTIVGDDSSGTLINGGETLKIAGGTNVTTAMSGDTLTITSSGGGSAITVQDEGGALSTAATTFNFVGAGVTASGTGATKTITVSGSSTSGGNLGDLQVNGTIMSPVSTNADLTLTANGTGDVVIADLHFNQGLATVNAQNANFGELELKPTSAQDRDILILKAGTVSYDANNAKNSEFRMYVKSGDTGSSGRQGGLWLYETNTSQSNFLIGTNADADVRGISLVAGGGTRGRVELNIDASHNTDVNLVSSGSGLVKANTFKIADAYTFPTSDGSAGQVLQTNGSGTLSFATVSGGSASTGDITFNGSTMISPSNGDITLDPSGTGDINLSAREVFIGDSTTDSAIISTETDRALFLAQNMNLASDFSSNAGGFINIASNGTLILRPADGNQYIYNESSTVVIGRSSNAASMLTGSGRSATTLTTNGYTNTWEPRILLTPPGSSSSTAHKALSKITMDAGDTGSGSIEMTTVNILMTRLPTSDPTTAGQLWNDSGTLKISAG